MAEYTHQPKFGISTSRQLRVQVMEGEKHRIHAFEMLAYRRVLRAPWTAKRTNKWVLDTIKTRYV